MKLKALLIAACVTMSLSASAALDDYFDVDSVYINDFVITPDQDSVVINVNFSSRDGNYAALGFDVNLPQDTTLFKFGAFPGRRGAKLEYQVYDPDERFLDHVHAFLYHQDENFTRVLIYSGTNALIYKGNGPIGQMIVKYVGPKPAQTTDYYGYINNANASDPTDTSHAVYFKADGSTTGRNYVKGYGQGYRFKITVEGTTAVNDVNADKAVSSVKYYNLQGMESAEPFDGVNIVVKTYTDGSKSAAKQIIR